MRAALFLRLGDRCFSAPLRLQAAHGSRWRGACVGGAALGGLALASGTALAKEPEMQQQVWVWGKSQCIPGGAPGDILYPQRIEWFEKNTAGWKTISFGPSFGAALDKKGKVFLWGEESAAVGPLEVKLQGEVQGANIVDLQCASVKIFLLTAGGDVFVLDGIPEKLQGLSSSSSSSSEASRPREVGEISLPAFLVPGLPRRGWLNSVVGKGGVKQMSIGMEHACFVTHSGELWSVGGNEWGQCGTQPPRQKGPMGAVESFQRVEVERPIQVHFPESAAKIEAVAVGGRHTLALDKSGRLYSFGDDRRIQLGLGDTRTGGRDERHSYGVLHQDALGGKDIKAEMKRAVSYRYYDPHMQVSPVETIAPHAYNRPPYPPPSFVACGEDFTIAVHRDSPDWYPEAEMTNVLICCGENAEGQCGRGFQQQQQVWTPVRLPKRSRTIGLTCGQGHCLALLSNGDCYAWGSNTQGQLGNGKRAYVTRPVKVAQKPLPLPEEPVRVPDAAETVEPPPPPPPLPGRITAVYTGFRSSAALCEVPVDR